MRAAEDRGPPSTGSFTTPPLHLDWSVHHTTNAKQRPATAREGACRRPFSAASTTKCPVRQVLPRRPNTARNVVVPASKVVEIPSLPATVATISSNAIAEAALREQHLVKDADPLCGTSVEIRPLHGTMPRGNRTADYYRARGYHYRTQGDFRSAIREYQTALKMAPRDFKALFNLGLVYDQLGETRHALSCYRRACKVDDQNMYLHFNMGICYLHDEDFDKAIGCFTRAIDVDGGCSIFFKNRAFAYRKAGRYAEAAKDYTTMGYCDNPEGYSMDLPLGADDDGQTTLTNQDDILPPRTCPVYHGSMTSDHGMFYYDSKPLYTPRDSCIRALTTMDRTNPRICYKIAAAPPETRSDADLQFLMDYTAAYPLCKHLSAAVHRALCAQVCAVRLTASTVLFQEDDDGGFVYFLLVGRINLFKHNLVKPDTSDGSRPTVETFLKSVPVENVHTEAALLDLDNLRQQTVDAEETPMYTLRAGAEFGHQGRFRHLARSCTAVVEAHSELIVVPWATVFETEANESRSSDMMEFLGKLRLFRSLSTSELHLLTLKARRLVVPKATVVQVPGQAHEGLLVVRRGMCKLITHNSSMLGSRRPRGACLATKTGVKKSHQHNALHTYTTMEHEDSPMAFFHANQALTRHLLAVPSSLRLETVHKRLGARDFVGEESFLSNESNRRVHATHTFVTDSECELLYLRKADFFSDTSYYTRQRVRANIQRTAAEDPPSPTHPPNQQDRDEVKWEAYKQKLVHEVLHKRG
ncbi:hypothetical protein H310_03401 [Aphanomyces invadans]|uniref:Cyclic nucleotide-binding domain-containing protein n=1 Tax=Aphanomyces invadans TaxID=157072 RepID=A0A024UII0_9STRA|nr:hypothetical protein H310_03401 [Aphanomyces invadans]ETW05682.1 hypothetical protein H310_03401 [Aphanomyces invadans]|eukprot:XP_008865459.1 hypothetical protein H310_03401 [Aphanomyces invadans]